MAHQVGSGSWTRRYTYAEPSQIVAAETGNRLSATSLPGDPAAGPYTGAYQHDAHGNMTVMPHLAALTWDEDDRLRSTARAATRQRHAADHLLRLRRRRAAGAQGHRRAGRRGPGRPASRRNGSTSAPSRSTASTPTDGTTITLVARNAARRLTATSAVALVETRTAGTDKAPAQLVRYQHGNHLGSAVLELDDQSDIISYEEYFPFGSTSYQAVASQTDLPKRYRYTGKERDDENDLYYHGARYYAPWLGRWISCDPSELVDGINLYAYVSNDPVSAMDPTGRARANAKVGLIPEETAREWQNTLYGASAFWVEKTSSAWEKGEYGEAIKAGAVTAATGLFGAAVGLLRQHPASSADLAFSMAPGMSVIEAGAETAVTEGGSAVNAAGQALKPGVPPAEPPAPPVAEPPAAPPAPPTEPTTAEPMAEPMAEPSTPPGTTPPERQLTQGSPKQPPAPKPPGPTTDPRTGHEVGQFSVDPKGNAMIQPKGGDTVPGPKPHETHTLYPNKSNYQRLNPLGHKNDPAPHGHGHLPGTGPNKAGQGPSLATLPLQTDVTAPAQPQVVLPNSRAAHWPINH